VKGSNVGWALAHRQKNVTFLKVGQAPPYATIRYTLYANIIIKHISSKNMPSSFQKSV